MTMDERERTERIKKKRGQTNSDRAALSPTFTACVSGIEPASAAAKMQRLQLLQEGERTPESLTFSLSV